MKISMSYPGMKDSDPMVLLDRPHVDLQLNIAEGDAITLWGKDGDEKGIVFVVTLDRKGDKIRIVNHYPKDCFL